MRNTFKCHINHITGQEEKKTSYLECLFQICCPLQLKANLKVNLNPSWHFFTIFGKEVEKTMKTCCVDMKTCCFEMKTWCVDMKTCCVEMKTCCIEMKTCCVEVCVVQYVREVFVN